MPRCRARLATVVEPHASLSADEIVTAEQGVLSARRPSRPRRATRTVAIPVWGFFLPRKSRTGSSTFSRRRCRITDLICPSSNEILKSRRATHAKCFLGLWIPTPIEHLVLKQYRYRLRICSSNSYWLGSPAPDQRGQTISCGLRHCGKKTSGEWRRGIA